VALRAAWRRIKFSNVGDFARQIPPKPFLPSHCKSTRARRIALHDIPVFVEPQGYRRKLKQLNKKVGVETGREYLSLPPKNIRLQFVEPARKEPEPEVRTTRHGKSKQLELGCR